VDAEGGGDGVVRGGDRVRCDDGEEEGGVEMEQFGSDISMELCSSHNG